MSANSVHIFRIAESARRPLDGELEKLYGRFIATRFVLQGLLWTLSRTMGSKKILDDVLIDHVTQLDDGKLFDQPPPERVLGAQSDSEYDLRVRPRRRSVRLSRSSPTYLLKGTQ